MPHSAISAAVLAVACSAVPANAATLTYSFASGVGVTSPTGLTASNVTTGTGTAIGVVSQQLSTTGWSTGAQDVTDHVTFTLTPTAGYYVDISNVSFISDRAQSGSSGTGPTSAAVQYNSLSQVLTTPQPSGKDPQSLSANFSLTDLTSAAQFKIYGWNNNGTASTAWVLDEITTTYDTQSRASLSTAITPPTTSRVIKNSSQSYTLNVQNSSLAAGTQTTEALAYSLNLTGSPVGVTVAGSSTDIAGAGSVNRSLTIDTSTLGIKGGGNVVVNTTNAWRTNGTAGATQATHALATVNVIDNRQITAGSAGSPINVGKVLTGYTKVVTNQSFGSTAAQDVATDIQLLAAGGAVTDGNGTFTIGSGSAVTFDGTTTTGQRNLSFNFGTSGTRTAQAASITNATAKIENLTGEVLQPVAITYTADVYEAVQLSYNNSSPIGAGGAVQISNAATTGAQRAAAKVTGRSITGHSSGWNISGLNPNTTIDAGSSASGTATFNSNGKINGTYVGTLSVDLAYDDATIQGIGSIDSQTWNLQTTVNGVVANAGQGSVRSGHSYAGFGLKRNSGKQTEATFLGGTSSADRDFDLIFSNGTSVLYSDALDVSSTNGDLLVLQMSYDPTGLTETQEQALVLMWKNGSGDWVNAVQGNSDGGVGATAHLSAYESGFFALSHFGVDTTNNVAWAVIDHNSEFGVALVPEPTTLATFLLGGLALRRRRR